MFVRVAGALIALALAVALFALPAPSVANTAYVASLGGHGGARWTLERSVYVNVKAMAPGVWKQQLWTGTCSDPGVRAVVLPSLVVPASGALAKTTAAVGLRITRSGGVVLRLLAGGAAVCGAFVKPVVPSPSPTAAPTALPTPTMVATPTPSPTTPGSSQSAIIENFDEPPSAWDIYEDRGQATGEQMQSIPGVVPGSTAARLTFASTVSYAGVQMYRKTGPMPAVQAVELRFDWRFPATTLNNAGSPSLVQAVEPAINKWSSSGLRYEWGLQWQNVEDSGSPGVRWRIWDGHDWVDIGVPQALTGDIWHSFWLQGDIRNGQVHYVAFGSDGLVSPIGASYAPFPTAGDDKIVVTQQADSNYYGQGYAIDLDNVTVRWFNNSPWP